MSDQAASDGSWRISDGDREAATQALGEHYATGRLDKAEYDERVDRAWAARSNVELSPLFADLPAPHGNVVAPVVARAGAARAHRPIGWAPRRRGPLGPLGPLPFLVIPLAFLLHAPWLLLVPVVAWCVLRPARRWR
jgi:hypothetical protein